jgi:hypothetical protein
LHNNKKKMHEALAAPALETFLYISCAILMLCLLRAFAAIAAKNEKRKRRVSTSGKHASGAAAEELTTMQVTTETASM